MIQYLSSFQNLSTLFHLWCFVAFWSSVSFFLDLFQFVTVIAHVHLAVWGATQEDIVVFLKQHGIHARVGATTPEHLGQRVEIFGKHGDFCEGKW